MRKTKLNQGTQTQFGFSDHLETWLEAFLFDRKAQNVSKGTLHFYQVKFRTLLLYCEGRAITTISELTADELRRFLVWLADQGHNPGGQHAIYRAVKAFFRWFEAETEPEGWRNPFDKVKPPMVPLEPLEPVQVETVKAMAAACNPKTFYGARDRAMLLGLLDTGARAHEFLDVDLSDINPARGDVLIRQGKGHKPRTVYLGRQSRRVLRAYLKHRQDDCPAQWVSDELERLSYWGLREVIRRRAINIGIKPPSLHDFRRAFAITMHRNGVDLVTIARLMGHTTLTILQRYLKQLPEDLHEAHKKGGPVDTTKK